MNRYILSLLLSLTLSASVSANAKTDDTNEARRVFDKAYSQVFGQQGATMHYDVNIIGIYKTSGTIWYKGKKQRFTDERVDTWNDGTTAYMVYRKKKTIEIHHANSDKKDKYSGKFKFSLDDFDYSMEHQSDGLMLTLKQHKGAKGTIKEVKALIDAKSFAPIKVRLKVMFFWATIKISRFRSGGISDKMFVFPSQNYGSDYKIVDKR